MAETAPSLLLTVLGELVLPDGDSVWTASLLQVMSHLGVETQTARQAIARAANAGLIVSRRQGRTACWTVTAAGKSRFNELAERARSLTSPPKHWDGNCLVVAVTIPQQLRSVRKRLYSVLSWQGFGHPAPGLWASPHVDRAEEVKLVIDDLGLREHTISFIGGTLGVGLSDSEIVQRAWDLKSIGARYADMISTFSNLEPIHGDETLRYYLALVDYFHQFPTMDPQLPEELLPDWIGRHAAELFVKLQEKWSTSAREHWREIVRESIGALRGR